MNVKRLMGAIVVVYGILLGSSHALAAEASGDSVDLEGGARPDALEGRVAHFTVRRLRAEVPAERLLVEWERRKAFAFARRQLENVVIEVVDGDSAVSVLEVVEDPGQKLDRVGNRSAVVAGVEVCCRSLDSDLGCGYAAQTVAD